MRGFKSLKGWCNVFFKKFKGVKFGFSNMDDYIGNVSFPLFKLVPVIFFSWKIPYVNKKVYSRLWCS